MNLTQIKQTLDIIALDLSISKDEKGDPTKWLRYWNNKTRISLVMHEDVFNHIKDHPDTTKLALKYEAKATKTGDQAGMIYDSYILIHAESIEHSI